jgi:hypothetical protein
MLNRLLQALAEQLIFYLIPIFKACVTQEYHFAIFKKARTVVIRKSDKKEINYIIAKGYRPIALLNIIGKVLEKIIATRLSEAAEAHKLLPKQQIGVRKGRTINTALQLFTDQIHAV